MNKITFDNLPQAIGHLTEQVDELKKLLTRKHIREPTLQNKLSVDRAIALMSDHGLTISRSKLYKLTSKQQIPFSKFNNRIVFNKEDLDDWITENTSSKTNFYDNIKNVVESAKYKYNKSK
jgi:excisionase family DNA binding protein